MCKVPTLSIARAERRNYHGKGSHSIIRSLFSHEAVSVTDVLLFEEESDWMVISVRQSMCDINVLDSQSVTKATHPNLRL